MPQFSNGEIGSSVRAKINAAIALIDSIIDFGSKSIITSTERTKLNGIQSGAQANIVANYSEGIINTTVLQLNEAAGSNSLGILSINNTGVGEYEIISNTTPFVLERTICNIIPNMACFIDVTIVNTSTISFRTYDLSGSLTDSLFDDGRYEIKLYG